MLREVDEAERLLWTERAKTSKIGGVIAAVSKERAHVWVWHDKPGESSRSGETQHKRPSEPSKPPTRDQRQMQDTEHEDATVGSLASQLRGGKKLCQKYQKGQCDTKHCKAGEHLCAMVIRASGHVCGLRHPACQHRWAKDKAKK